MNDQASATKCGFVAIVGATNAGKSTLVNQAVGTKISIVTHKVQTTRSRVLGVMIEDNAQIVLVDTPGIFDPRRRLDRAMIQAAWQGAADADVVALIVDAKRGATEDVLGIIEKLADIKAPKLLVLNKIDLLDRSLLLDLTAKLNASGIFRETLMISALNGDGVRDLVDQFARHMPDSPWLFPEDQLTDMPNRLLAAEITREKAFLRLHQELPYSLTVETDTWEERRDGSVKIDQTIFVTRDGHKGIVIGKNGATLKAIGAESRAELEEILGHRVHLFLFVKVRERWLEDPERFRNIGIEFNS
ncbi:MAG: GTPase Era [Rhodospirillales bacterium]